MILIFLSLLLPLLGLILKRASSLVIKLLELKFSFLFEKKVFLKKIKSGLHLKNKIISAGIDEIIAGLNLIKKETKLKKGL